MSLLKTINFESKDYHHAKCVFGHLRRVEIEEVENVVDGPYSDQDSQDFLEIYQDIFKDLKSQVPTKTEPERKSTY